jgi:hypothetical protein
VLLAFVMGCRFSVLFSLSLPGLDLGVREGVLFSKALVESLSDFFDCRLSSFVGFYGYIFVLVE